MSFENLFIRSKKSIGGIELDAVLTESHANSIRLTRNPIELGADITDHSIIQLKRINIVARVSDTPLGAASFAEIIDFVSGLFGTSTSENITRSEAAYNAILSLMELREPINVQTKLKTYSDMIIVGLSTTQDKDTSRIAQMSITLEQVIITESKLIKLDITQLLEGSTRQQGSAAENKGRVEPVTPDSGVEGAVNRSILKSITG